MNTNRIYYFSATGNSLVVARQVAEHLGDCELVHVADALAGNTPAIDATSNRLSRVGFVFPVYGWGPPRIVHQFVDQVTIPDADYFFAIATHGGTVASALQVLSKQLASRGVGLDAGFAVKEGHYQPDPNHAKHPVVRFVRAINGYPETRARSFAQRCDEILDVLLQKRSVAVELDRAVGSAVAARMHPFSLKTFAKADDTFVQTDDCIACGICARICPRANIEIENASLSWGGNCEGCFACVQWCPKRAIQIKGVEWITQGHNPACTAKDLFRNR